MNCIMPREKLIYKGIEYLSDSELLAIIINSGTSESSSIEIANQLLESYDLRSMARLSYEEFILNKGIGPAKACILLAAFELAKRKDLISTNGYKIKSSQDAYDYLSPYFTGLNHEEFRVLLLDRSNKVKKCVLLSKGGISGTIVDPKLVFKYALDALASSVILSHNHPSGNLQALECDITITNKLAKAGQLLEIKVLDHLIISDIGYYSFADESVI